MAKMTPKTKALLASVKPSVAWMVTHPNADLITAFEAGQKHARGRADRLTKAEREVIEAAKVFARTPSSYGLEQELLQAVSALEELERAKGRK